METSPKNLNDEIRELKSELNKLNAEKESWFSKKEELQKEISLLISEVRKTRSPNKPSQYNSKSERDKQNTIVKDLISKVKEINNKKAEIIKKNKIKGDPERLSKLIELLEHKIETEVISFEKEKEIMKKINALKKQYSQYSELSSVIEEYHKISKSIREHREKANEYHNLMRKQSQENKEENIKILDLSKKIILLRKEKDQAFKNFLEYKEKFKEINNKLKENLAKLNQRRNEYTKKKQEYVHAARKNIDSLLNKRIEKVEEKIKKKEKLTTEDLLAFQKKA